MIPTAVRGGTRALRALVLRRALRLGPRAFALLAVAGLLAPSAARVAGPDGAGWLLGHGHIFLSVEAATHPHTHPWDHPGSTSSAAGTAAASDAGVLFTLGDLDAASALAMLALPVFALLLAVSWHSEAVAVPIARSRDVRSRPLVPPPQR